VKVIHIGPVIYTYKNWNIKKRIFLKYDFIFGIHCIPIDICTTKNTLSSSLSMSSQLRTKGHGFNLSVCVLMNFATYRFVSVTIVSIMKLSKYNFKVSNARLTDCMGPMISENLILLGLPVTLIFQSRPLHCCITH
jgi:hypothetical protein